ncbi:uncharacterized protein PGTG_01604 [Puccinia graminis f. sp. tritici CRL 75-36-700-3]|uniref:Uncharacterized protein n=1 Tax=Puccinia graminis f. sp. tritici (strain CRL 75-36-700-3 / race SCCL) TaxID=418459 RepID=E3JS90_PUCGT|nr:uncharacterized protein PGTG_01604 [Puccinia graminis f. sp. tritici CRL 75-36-700-3]EFP75011.1 hypothetical protein PGTG_01604 [Puccinia graminis f. sp. tritici CRL 75-36-700-3]
MQLSNVLPIFLVFFLQGASTYAQAFGCKDNYQVPNWPHSGCVKMSGMKQELADVIPAHWNNKASSYECGSDANGYLTVACCAHEDETRWNSVHMAVTGRLGLCAANSARMSSSRLKIMCFVFSSLSTFRPNRYINGDLQKVGVEKKIEINGDLDLVFTTIAAHFHAVQIGLHESRR